MCDELAIKQGSVELHMIIIDAQRKPYTEAYSYYQECMNITPVTMYLCMVKLVRVSLVWQV